MLKLLNKIGLQLSHLITISTVIIAIGTTIWTVAQNTLVLKEKRLKETEDIQFIKTTVINLRDSTKIINDNMLLLKNDVSNLSVNMNVVNNILRDHVIKSTTDLNVIKSMYESLAPFIYKSTELSYKNQFPKNVNNNDKLNTKNLKKWEILITKKDTI